MTKLDILYEDNHVIVVFKPAGILSQADKSGDVDMLTIIKSYLKEKYNKPGNVYLGLVHRLDRPVGGVMVFAKTSKAASRLSDQVREKIFKKKYLAVVDGRFEQSKGILEDYLYKDGRENLSIIVNATFPDAKKAILNYRHCSTLMVLEEGEEVSLMEIELLTGRHHQIRAQMSNAGMPLLGDSKYGSDRSKELSRDIGCKNVALCAYKLSFKHPTTHKEMVFEREPDEELFDPFLNEGIL